MIILPALAFILRARKRIDIQASAAVGMGITPNRTSMLFLFLNRLYQKAQGAMETALAHFLEQLRADQVAAEHKEDIDAKPAIPCGSMVMTSISARPRGRRLGSRLVDADSDEAAPLFRDDCAP